MHPEIRDYGNEPFVFNLNHAATMYQNFRTTLWTGRDLQLTLMSIPAGGEIGIEMHPDVDQFLRVEQGCAMVLMGCCRDHLKEVGYVNENYAILVPAGTWHNIVNAENYDLKLYSLYAPPQHAAGTVHQTKEDALHEDH